MKALLSSTFFGPVQWYQKLYHHGTALIEHHDSFIKQTYRNRCVIATANGAQILTVPVCPAVGAHPCGRPMKKDREGICTRISDHGNWRHIHWNALASAYGESPFFEFYADDIRPFFEKRWTYLYDFNMEITLKMCELLDIRPDIKPTDEFLKTSHHTDEDLVAQGCEHHEIIDYRDIIRPKHPLSDPDFTPKPYYQVYRQRQGFLPNLSILDLLFNMGNESVLYL